MSRSSFYVDKAFCSGCRVTYPASVINCAECGKTLRHSPRTNKDKRRYRETRNARPRLSG